MKINNVCMIGGSGFVGGHIAHLLTAQEINLRVPTRRRERAKSLLVLPTADVVEADIHDPTELDQLLVGMEAVINLVGILNGDFVSAHVELPKKIVAACKRNKISRLLHVSALNANINGASAYFRSKGEGEKVIIESDLKTTIFRPSVIFGPEDSFLNLFADLARRLPMLPLASPNAKLQPVFVENVAQIIVSSLSTPDTIGQSYDLCGPKIYTLKQLVEYAAFITGHDLTVIGLNDSLSYLQAMVMEVLPGKLMTRDNYFSLKVDSTCSCDEANKLAAVFDIHPTELEEVAPLYLAHLMPRERYNVSVIERGDKISSLLETYLVGGSVRDELLKLSVKDHDYVVVGSTPEEMARLGFRSVGKDFLVYLHPESQDQYALARTERKVARGYKGFQVYTSPKVTLQEDLARRDLTINAIAKDKDGNIVDPFNGVADLEAGLLRHVSPAFSEDPVRVLRTARFSARFGFHVAPETLSLMKELVRNGEVDSLVPERVWQEFARGLMEKNPSRMFYVLRECGALARIMPEVDVLFGIPQPARWHPEIDTGVHVMQVIDYAASKNYSLTVRFAALTHDLGKGVTPQGLWPHHASHEFHSVKLVKGLCERIKIPKDSRDLALLVARFHCNVHRTAELCPATIGDMLLAVDAYRKPERFEEFIQACACDFHGRSGFMKKPYPQAIQLREAFNAASSVDSGAIASSQAKIVSDPTLLSVSINTKVREARIAQIKSRLA